jgi:hypothetical protein
VGNVAVRVLLQRAWDVHTLVDIGHYWQSHADILGMEQIFLGGSGPRQMRFEVNGVVVKEK